MLFGVSASCMYSTVETQFISKSPIISLRTSSPFGVTQEQHIKGDTSLIANRLLDNLNHPITSLHQSNNVISPPIFQTSRLLEFAFPKPSTVV